MTNQRQKLNTFFFESPTIEWAKEIEEDFNKKTDKELRKIARRKAMIRKAASN